MPVDGVVLLCPMIALALSWPTRMALWMLSYSPFGRLALIPSSATSNEKQYRDAARRAECAADKLSYGGLLRPASAWACVDAATGLRAALGRISVPFLCLTAGADVVVDNAGAAELLARSATPADLKSSRCFPDALHGLLCEPEERRAEIEEAIVEFVGARVAPSEAV